MLDSPLLGMYFDAMTTEGRRFSEGNGSALGASERVKNTLLYGGAGGLAGAMILGVPGAVIGTLLIGTLAFTEKRKNSPQ